SQQRKGPPCRAAFSFTMFLTISAPSHVSQILASCGSLQSSSQLRLPPRSLGQHPAPHDQQADSAVSPRGCYVLHLLLVPAVKRIGDSQLRCKIGESGSPLNS